MLLKKRLFKILVILLPFLLKANGNKNSTRIIIVGAGSSGIAAASKLFENGFKNIKILEAENRIGGRIHTTKFDDYLVDLGAQWVDGEDGNVAFQLAWPLGLLDKKNLRSRHYKFFDSSGNRIDQSLADDVHNYFNGIAERFQDFARKNRNLSKGYFYENELNKYFKKHPKWEGNEKGMLHLLNMFQMTDVSAVSWWNLSASSDIEYKETPGDHLINWKELGYSTILDILMKRYPNPEEELPVVKNTLLNTEVSLIDYRDKVGKVTVKTTNGKTYYADHVIVTCSLGVLKHKYNSLFKPSLPEEKQKTIQALGFGGVAKIYLSFKEPWWPLETLPVGFAFLWKKEDLKKLKKDPEKIWLHGLMGFTAVEHKPRLLLGWISGKYSLEMEKLSDEQIQEHCLEVLQKFLGNSYKITVPTGMIRSLWNTNEHFKGTYSFRTVRTERENVWHAALGIPIDEAKPIILFAGEATNAHHFATVHGAIETGWREAERIIKFYQNRKDTVEPWKKLCFNFFSITTDASRFLSFTRPFTFSLLQRICS